MRLVIDMNMSIKWVEALRHNGFEAEHWSGLGTRDAPDRTIMDHAAENDAIVVTRDLDFSSILAVNGFERPSVVHLSERDRFSPATVERLSSALRRFEAELDAGAIVSLAAGRVRMRRLPLGSNSGGDAE
jgi:predicted nuclease of predicted toxin-antitoxin system